MKKNLCLAILLYCISYGSIKAQFLDTAFLSFNLQYNSSNSLFLDDPMLPTLHQGGIGVGLGLEVPLYKNLFGLSFEMDYQENGMPLIETHQRSTLPTALVVNGNKIVTVTGFVGGYLLLGKNKIHYQLKFLYGWANSISTSAEPIRTRYMDYGLIKNEWYSVLRINNGLIFNLRPKIQLGLGISHEFAILPVDDVINPAYSHDLGFDKFGGYFQIRYAISSMKD